MTTEAQNLEAKKKTDQLLPSTSVNFQERNDIFLWPELYVQPKKQNYHICTYRLFHLFSNN